MEWESMLSEKEMVDFANDYNMDESICSEREIDGDVVFSRESPLQMKEGKMPKDYSDTAKKVCSKASDVTAAVEYEARGKKKDKQGQQRRQERAELGRMLQGAVSSRDWELAESLISLADPYTVNDALCISLDSIWFLTTHQELNGITGLIKKIIANGANDFTKAALRTSFLASCVSVCQCRTMSLTDTVIILARRLQERLQECNANELLKVEAGAKVQKFIEWALKCIGVHYRNRGYGSRGVHATNFEVQLQLSAFKVFLDLAGDSMTGKVFTEAFDAVCFPLTLFSNFFEPGWASGTSATLVQGLMGMLVEGGADNISQCFLEAARFGSTELVRILLQIAQRNSLDVDVDLALGFASHYGKIGTMECLVEEGHAVAFLGPLMRAAERGVIQVVQWFVQRGCRDMELCLALTAATSRSQVGIVAYLLPHVPQHALLALSIEILKAAGERCGGILDGIAFLLSSNFLGDPAATYTVADCIARSEDEGVAPELKAFLRDHWSEAAFTKGLSSGEDHYVNFVRVFRRGESALCLRDLPAPLVTAIAYLPLYQECVRTGRRLLSQRLRGQLVEAAGRVSGRPVDNGSHWRELLAVLEHHLPRFFVHPSYFL